MAAALGVHKTAAMTCVVLKLQARMLKRVKSLVVGRGLTSIVSLSFISALIEIDHTTAAMVWYAY